MQGIVVQVNVEELFRKEKKMKETGVNVLLVCHFVFNFFSQKPNIPLHPYVGLVKIARQKRHQQAS